MNRFLPTAIALALAAGSLANAAELPETAVILDPDCIFYSGPYPTISPNGKWIAYVSKGSVCVCSTTVGEPRRVLEVPNSWTWPHLQAPAGHTPPEGSFEALAKGLSRDQYRALLGQLTNTVYGLHWTSDSEGFVFGVKRHDADSWKSETFLASVDGEITKLAQGDSGSLTRGIVAGTLTCDRKFLVATENQVLIGEHRPLIWSIADNKPRATCFHVLRASTSSDRWIGIEKDSKQLVIVDSDFEVLKRFADAVPANAHTCYLEWSPNERYVFWKNQIGFDHYSNWVGDIIDLETGAKLKLDGQFMSEHIVFTGRHGEIVRCGQDGVPHEFISGARCTGAHLTLVESDGATKDLWRITIGPNEPMPGMLTNQPGDPPLKMSPDGNLFAIGIPRPVGERSGCFWHLINRDGTKWRFPGVDNAEYVSPYAVVGFADDGRMVVAYDSKRLFAFPLAEILKDANRVD